MAFGDPDASTPAYVKANSATKAVTTASFTPPVGARLVAFAVHDTAGGNLTNTSQVTDSQGLTWTRIATHSKQDDGTGANNGHIAVSIATVTSSVPMTVTTTGTNTNNPAGLYVLVATGVDTTTPIDVQAEGHNTNAVVSQAATVVTNGSRGYIIASDWNLAANMTAGANQTAVVSDGIGAPDMRFYVGRQNAVSAPGSVTMSTASPTTGNQNNWIVIFLRPAAGGGAPSADASLAVTASFGTASIVQDIGAAALNVTVTTSVGTTASVAKPVTAAVAVTASVSVSATKDIPTSASLAVVVSTATTAVPSRIGATSVAVTASLSTSAASAKPVDASVAITATLTTSAAVGTIAALAITATLATSATPTRVAGAAVDVVVTVATSAVDARTTMAALALTVALIASASVSGSEPDLVGGTISADYITAAVTGSEVAASIGFGARSAGVIVSTESAGVVDGL